MTPLEIIAEYKRGCSDASPDNLEACPACAVHVIDVLERKLREIGDDSARLLFATQDIDGFGSIAQDKYEYALQVADDNGREEPTLDDELNGLRRMIDDAMEKVAPVRGFV